MIVIYCDVVIYCECARSKFMTVKFRICFFEVKSINYVTSPEVALRLMRKALLMNQTHRALVTVSIQTNCSHVDISR